MAAARDLLERLLERRDLTQPEAEELLGVLTDPATAAAFAGAVLAALRSKGAVADEVRGFAQAMRRLARRPRFPPGLPAVDVVGTGGDGSGSLNISTGTALLTAACGVPVVKHGNRSISSRAGSADVLEALGLALPLDERNGRQGTWPPATSPSCSRPTTTRRPRRSPRCGRRSACAPYSTSSGRSPIPRSRPFT